MQYDYNILMVYMLLHAIINHHTLSGNFYKLNGNLFLNPVILLTSPLIF
jgi:hypothetical protein